LILKWANLRPGPWKTVKCSSSRWQEFLGHAPWMERSLITLSHPTDHKINSVTVANPDDALWRRSGEMKGLVVNVTCYTFCLGPESHLYLMYSAIEKRPWISLQGRRGDNLGTRERHVNGAAGQECRGSRVVIPWLAPVVLTKS